LIHSQALKKDVGIPDIYELVRPLVAVDIRNVTD